MKTKRKGRVKSILFLVLFTLFIGIFTFGGIQGFELFGYEFRTFDRVITKGLDLQGGVSVLMEIQEDEVSKEDLEKIINFIKEVAFELKKSVDFVDYTTAEKRKDDFYNQVKETIIWLWLS